MLPSVLAAMLTGPPGEAMSVHSVAFGLGTSSQEAWVPQFAIRKRARTLFAAVVRLPLKGLANSVFGLTRLIEWGSGLFVPMFSALSDTPSVGHSGSGDSGVPVVSRASAHCAIAGGRPLTGSMSATARGSL